MALFLLLPRRRGNLAISQKRGGNLIVLVEKLGFIEKLIRNLSQGAGSFHICTHINQKLIMGKAIVGQLTELRRVYKGNSGLLLGPRNS